MLFPHWISVLVCMLHPSEHTEKYFCNPAVFQPRKRLLCGLGSCNPHIPLSLLKALLELTVTMNKKWLFAPFELAQQSELEWIGSRPCHGFPPTWKIQVFPLKSEGPLLQHCYQRSGGILPRFECVRLSSALTLFSLPNTVWHTACRLFMHSDALHIFIFRHAGTYFSSQYPSLFVTILLPELPGFSLCTIAGTHIMGAWPSGRGQLAGNLPGGKHNKTNSCG